MKPLNKLLILIIYVWITLAVVFGIYDLEISKAIVDTTSTWGTMGTNIGFHVRDALLFIVVLILIGSFFTKNIQRDIGYFALIISFLNLVYFHIDPEMNSLLAPIILIVFVSSFVVLTFNKDWKNYVKIAVMVLLLYISLTVILDITKVLFGRVRYKYLNSNYSDYTQWYIINGPDSENQSFPSGHSAYSWLFLPFLVLIKNEKMKKPIKALILISVIGYGLFISMSRIILGGHYFSDILFSTGIASVLTILFYKKFYPEDLKAKGEIKELKRFIVLDSEHLKVKYPTSIENNEVLNFKEEIQPILTKYDKQKDKVST
ncbi:MAG: phosphatase PAP2 family protein [Promethearchaeota archaeon]